LVDLFLTAAGFQRTPENVELILDALEELQAEGRDVGAFIAAQPPAKFDLAQIPIPMNWDPRKS
jgi:hypothetical protein